MRHFEGIYELYLGMRRKFRELPDDESAAGAKLFLESGMGTIKSVFGLSPEKPLKRFHRPVKKHADLHEEWERVVAEFRREKSKLQSDIRLDSPEVASDEVVIRSIRLFGQVDTYCRILEEDVDIEAVSGI
jgi:hypothetical protein